MGFTLDEEKLKKTERENKKGPHTFFKLNLERKDIKKTNFRGEYFHIRVDPTKVT